MRRIFTQLLPHPDKRTAVFTTFILIVIGMVISRVVPNKIAENQAYLNFIFGAAFLLISGETVKYMVEGAIEDAANRFAELKIQERMEKHESELQEYKTKIEEYERSTPEIVLDRQNKEYRLAVLRASYPTSYDLKVLEDPLLSEDGKDILARESITRGLANEDDFLLAVAGKACQDVLELQGQNESTLAANVAFLGLRKNVYICLKAWLMLSIKNHRNMDVSKLIRSNVENQSVVIDRCILALDFIKNYIIDDQLLDDYLEERYRKLSRNILKDYLTRLINLLKNYQREEGTVQ